MFRAQVRVLPVHPAVPAVPRGVPAVHPAVLVAHPVGAVPVALVAASGADPEEALPVVRREVDSLAVPVVVAAPAVMIARSA